MFAFIDLKPDNLLLDSNYRVKITDFGISLQKEVGASTEEEISWFGRSLKGTPRYMAPEIIRGKKATPTCDVYAYGIVLWQVRFSKLLRGSLISFALHEN
jgi:serine/threonine protein kinase